MKISSTLLALFTLVIANSSVLATKHFVMNGDDSGNQSLRYFIQSASPSDTIMFSPDIEIVTLTTEELKIEKPICIFGIANKTEIRRSTASGTPDFRIFRLINSGAVYLKNLVINNGKSMLIGGIYPQPGGAIQVNDTNSFLYIDHCIIQNSKAASGPILDYLSPFAFAEPGANGGAIANYGHLEIKNSTIKLNSAGTGGKKMAVKSNNNPLICLPSHGGSGGGIWSNHYLKLSGCIIFDNSAGGGAQCFSYDPTSPWYGEGGHGGGVYAESDSYALLENCLIDYNGSGYGDPSGSGGGIMCSGYLDLINTTVVKNYSPSTIENGAGIRLYGGTSVINNCIITGNFLYSNIPSDVNVYYGSYSFRYSLVGHPANFEITDTSNLVNMVPSFIGSSDFHLAFNSPCINAGDPDTTGLPLYDLDGNIRVIENRVDMGAYEFQGYSPDGSASAPGDIFIFPNPLHDRFTIFIPENLRNTVTDAAVQTLSGQKVFETIFNSRTADQEVELPSSLSKGIYLLVIRNTKACTIHKIIKL